MCTPLEIFFFTYVFVFPRFNEKLGKKVFMVEAFRTNASVTDRLVQFFIDFNFCINPSQHNQMFFLGTPKLSLIFNVVFNMANFHRKYSFDHQNYSEEKLYSLFIHLKKNCEKFHL